LLKAVPAAAEDDSSAARETPPAVNQKGNPKPSPCDIVEKNNVTPTTPEASLHQDVTVVFRDLKSCLELRNSNDLTKYRLMLDGRTLTALKPIPNRQESYLKFALQFDPHDEKQRKDWEDIVRADRRSENVTITVVDTTTNDVSFSTQFLKFDVYPAYTRWVVVGLVVLFVSLVLLGWKSGMLRDNPSGTKYRRAVELPLSLGRVQMAWWFFLVVAAYLYIWMITGISYTPTGSVLALLGISSATAIAGAIVDRGKFANAEDKRTDLNIQQAVLTQRIDEINATNPPAGSDLAKDVAVKTERLIEVNARLAGTTPLTAGRHHGLWVDLLCDGDGVSFHRFQIVVWSVVLGIVFSQAVFCQLAMPDFDPALLGLMGLSSGTYVSFKFPEKTK
jgi:hypothetical protein